MTDHLRLEADEPGRYGGQCAEYCRQQHAKMRMLVAAESPARFAAWLEQQRRPAAPPVTAAGRGRQLVEQTACALCHTVRGTAALGTVGLDLTHLAGRSTLAGGALPNDTAYLHAWVTHAQALKPGAQMPDLTRYSGAELHDIVAYLRTLH